MKLLPFKFVRRVLSRKISAQGEAVQQIFRNSAKSSGAKSKSVEPTSALKSSPSQSNHEHLSEEILPDSSPKSFNSYSFTRDNIHHSPTNKSTNSYLQEFSPKISVIGVGGAGCNGVNNMISRGLSGVKFIGANTDAQHLLISNADIKLQLGRELTKGLGCGANPESGRLAALESRDEIAEMVQDSNMVFITAGMGGGTGTGAAPIIAEICLERDILTVAVVTTPFSFEGKHRSNLARAGLKALEERVDTLIVIPNQNLFKLITNSTTVMDAFVLADDVLLAGVKSVTDLMIRPGVINLDFADVVAVMKGMGHAIMGTGQAEGTDRAIRAADDAMRNPLLGSEMSVKSAKGMLVNISGGDDLTLYEVELAAQKITSEVADENANIVFGSTYDPSLNNFIRVSVVATGIDPMAHPSNTPK